jgi:hypothetical protein
MVVTAPAAGFGAGNVCAICPASHPKLLGGACERDPGCAFMGFGPSTTIVDNDADGTFERYCCDSIGANCNVRVRAVCGQ